MERYFQEFKLVEVQRTFYKIPKIKTMSNWREKAPDDFEFTVKAWQAITHPSSSPTWRRVGIKDLNGMKYGLLRPTKENFEAWRKTVEACKALGTDIVVVQTPPSFRCTEAHYRNACRFFEEASGAGVRIAWEPRGDWLDNLDRIRRVCDDYELIHIVDLLRRRPAILSSWYYTRLHGLNPREYDYKYSYSDEDLDRLAEILNELEDGGVEEVYVLFNNVEMVDDASHFLNIVKRRGLGKGS